VGRACVHATLGWCHGSPVSSTRTAWRLSREGQGVWRYDRTTEEWALLGFGGQRIGEAILILEESPDRLLVGVYPIPGDTTRIYRTDDGGESWEPSDHGTCGASIPRVRALAQDPADPAHILAGGNAFFASFDEGHTWSTLSLPKNHCGTEDGPRLVRNGARSHLT
jgi:hypothetical protein